MKKPRTSIHLIGSSASPVRQTDNCVPATAPDGELECRHVQELRDFLLASLREELHAHGEAARQISEFAGNNFGNESDEHRWHYHANECGHLEKLIALVERATWAQLVVMSDHKRTSSQ